VSKAPEEAVRIRRLHAEPVRLGEPDPIRGVREPWVDISFGLENLTPTRRYCVGSVLRTIYDPARSALVIDCAETDPERDSPGFREASVVPFPRPLFLRLQPGEELPHKVGVPVHTKRLEPTTDGRLAAVEIDLTTARLVVLRVAHAERPFRVGPRATPGHARHLLHAWGAVVEDTATVRIKPLR
jgi:hypothetical protein